MNNNLQLYNSSINPNTCPHWPEMPAFNSPMSILEISRPALETVATLEHHRLDPRIKSISYTIIDYMPKNFHDLTPYFFNGYMAYKCLSGDPISCGSAILTKIKPANKPENAIQCTYAGHFFNLLRFHAYRMEISRIKYLIPIAWENNWHNAACFMLEGAKINALKVFADQPSSILSLATFAAKWFADSRYFLPAVTAHTCFRDRDQYVCAAFITMQVSIEYGLHRLFSVYADLVNKPVSQTQLN